MDDEDYEEKPVSEVGYRKPPKEHQFKKGQSGNLKGRPRKAKPVYVPPGLAPLTAEVILAEARRIVPVRDGAKVHDLDTLQAMVRSLNVTGLKGNRRALVDAIKLARMAEEAQDKEWTALVDSVLEYKTSWKEEIAYCEINGLPRPDPLPHPDDIALDYVNRLIIYNGPADEKQKADWDRMRKRRNEHAEEAAYMRKWCRDEGVPVTVFAHSIAIDETFVKIMDGLFPDEATRRVPGFKLHEWRRANGVKAQLDREGWRSFMPPAFREAIPPRDEKLVKSYKDLQRSMPSTRVGAG